jgi:carbonic anhydrase
MTRPPTRPMLDARCWMLDPPTHSWLADDRESGIENRVSGVGTRLCLAVVFSLALVILSCGGGGHHEGDRVADGDHAQVHWGYAGEVGPEYWADLRPEFAPCREGVEQSPIDLTGAVPIEDAGIERRLGTEVLTLKQRARVMDLVDNGHTIQVTNDVPMALDLDGVHYELVQFHFHAPSEHTIDGEHAPLEVHLVHKSADGQLAVIGVLIEEGEHDVLWEPIIASLPEGPGDSRHVEDLDLNMNELRPLPKRYYRYRGSLTTPPCSEGVEWIVMAEKRQISSAQMAALVSHLHDNNRPVQPLGDRKIGFVSR